MATSTASPVRIAGVQVPQASDRPRRLERRLTIAAILCGFFAFWTSRYVMYSDGISYLDIADLYASGAWRSAVSDYWSPMFSWLLAVGLRLFHPAARFEAMMFHAILFGGYIAAVFAFRYLLRQLARALDPVMPADPELRPVGLVVAYSAFLWATLPLIRTCSPDVIVATLVYLVSGLLLRCTHAPAGIGLCSVFGASLGLCWLTKAALLPAGVAVLPFFAASVWRG